MQVGDKEEADFSEHVKMISQNFEKMLREQSYVVSVANGEMIPDFLQPSIGAPVMVDKSEIVEARMIRKDGSYNTSHIPFAVSSFKCIRINDAIQQAAKILIDNAKAFDKRQLSNVVSIRDPREALELLLGKITLGRASKPKSASKPAKPRYSGNIFDFGYFKFRNG